MIAQNKNLGGRPILETDQKQKRRNFYMNKAEWNLFHRWCSGEKTSEVIRRIVKQLISPFEN